ncbi:hypothetical protein UFOVP190_174 [uncultured Caudovirales phage]|uniref:Uncharacterized protein n=1 Tax=uncultured Caudovirales phage TaxID=2100421 RepID=A0A6J7WM03_9CAUD|nr:hypothetical protein UFOVP190_174 [uncultured Caudovirales phage]
MIKHAFIVTSAINSKFGVFKPTQRLQQTLATVASIRQRVPDAKIIIMECCGEPIKPEQENLLRTNCDIFVDYSHNEEVQALYDNDNWDVVKNGTEIMCFGRALAVLQHEGMLKDCDRIHKMSGRYLLTDDFDPATYEDSTVVDKIVIGPKYKSQFSIEVTTVPLQYMARLWSWPNSRIDEVVEVYSDSFIFFAERLAAGGYVDIEHVLYKFLNPDHVHEVQNLGVEGQIAPTGAAIKN